MAMILALNNVFCANLDRSTIILGMMHGSYGMGGDSILENKFKPARHD